MMRLRGILILLGAALTAGAAPPAFAAGVVSPNLVVDGGGEAVQGSPDGYTVVHPTGWTTAPGSHFTATLYGSASEFPVTDKGPPHRGRNFLAGGPNTGTSVATQTVALPAGMTGRTGVTYALQGYLGGFADQRDNSVLTAVFRTSSGAPVGPAAKVGPVTPAMRRNTTGELLVAVTGTVPRTARSVLVTLTMVRSAGDYDDGYADGLSLVLTD